VIEDDGRAGVRRNPRIGIAVGAGVGSKRTILDPAPNAVDAVVKPFANRIVAGAAPADRTTIRGDLPARDVRRQAPAGERQREGERHHGESKEEAAHAQEDGWFFRERHHLLVPSCPFLPEGEAAEIG